MPTKIDVNGEKTAALKREIAALRVNLRGAGKKASAQVDSGRLDARLLLGALKAIKRGDFTARLPEGLAGIDARIAEAFNDVAEANEAMTEELSDLSLAIAEGKTKRRLARSGRRGGWATSINAVNSAIEEVTGHSAEVARVIAAVGKGDFTQSVDPLAGDKPMTGEFLRNCKSLNGMVAQLQTFGEELTRVSLEIGVQGKLGAQARLPGVAGSWKELTDSINTLADNLTHQVRDVARVTSAVTQGDLTQKVTVEARGEVLTLKNTMNSMVEQLGSVAGEVSRVAREVGTDGVLDGQAQVRGASGIWRDLTDSVNGMAGNVSHQMRNIAQVTTAVAEGDFTKKLTFAARGEVLQLKDTVNAMVDQLSIFSDEVTRVAREVGTDGVLGSQAQVRGASGRWRELNDSVNQMASNLTGQVRNISEVASAVTEGDLSKKITVEAKGEVLALKSTINTMVDRLSNFQFEVSRVARLVGAEGTLGVAAEVKDVSGVWRELTDNVNGMANNLTDQIRDIAEVVTAVSQGDLSRKITIEARGEVLQLKTTMNQMVDMLGGFSSDVSRVAREIGTEGRLGGQAELRDVSGVWRDLTDNVNRMASSLTDQVRGVAEVSAAVAVGDLTKKVTVEARGEVLELKNTINGMVDVLGTFGAEVISVARDTGVDGKLGAQANVVGARGLWKELTDNVNLMANNLTEQVRDIAGVATAVTNGDLARKVTVEARGELLVLKNTINAMVDQLASFTAEVTRLAREVGTDGKLGGQAEVRGVSGTWRDLTDSVNLMADNLTQQVRSIAEVSTAISQGDLTKTIGVEARGEMLSLKNTVNTMVSQLSSLASEVTRVAREIGTEGRLGGQAEVPGVSGSWRELTNDVNQLGASLSNQVRDIALVTSSVARGDFSKKVMVEVRGETLELKNTINTMVDQLSSLAEEVSRVALEVGEEGKLGAQTQVRGLTGGWRELTDSVNRMADNLTGQVRNISQVITAVSLGDFTQKITVNVKGEVLELKSTINQMVDQLSLFAGEVTRLAREVGTEGILGGQSEVPGVAGGWRDLTDNVNVMARNLTEQMRSIAQVVTGIAEGDLSQQITFDSRGEVGTLAETINAMSRNLGSFAKQVTEVAHDVGVEGKLGGRADVPGALGVWRDLTNNVNELAGNLTNQVRAIADVARAVTSEDYSQTIAVEARGEVLVLRNNLNQMVGTLAESTRVNQDQDWLKTNLTKFARMLQGQRDLMEVAQQVMSELASVIGAQHGAFYLSETADEVLKLKLYASYAYKERKGVANEFALGEGLVGQCGFERQRILLTDIPADYIQISSGLGEAKPLNVVVLPILFEGQLKGVAELASFQRYSDTQLSFLEQLFESLGVIITTIESASRTDELLKESQVLTEELQTQQEELEQTNEELEEKARQVTEQKAEVELKNVQVEAAKTALEEKAEQLSLTSKYKSEFLANMSHELRTPLNSLLILSQQLAGNVDENLTDKQVEFAKTIHASGTDLLSLINEVLDLAKIESGTMAVEVAELGLDSLEHYVERSFRQIAVDRNLGFDITMHSNLPRSMRTDNQRLQQVLRNLLSNAFKFTEKGSVTLAIERVQSGWRPSTISLEQAEVVLAFSVTDTGIGIPKDRQNLIFEAFQQAEGGTSRKYGGTGLGLSISREIAVLLGGDIRIQSEPGKGSAFTFYLPQAYRQLAPRLAPSRAPRPSAHSTGISTGMAEPISVSNHALLETVVPDDRATIQPGDRSLLIIEDDESFAAILVDQAREKGFKALAATTGTAGLALAKSFKPDAVTLDLQLPDVHGWVVLDRLKHDPELRHIPVHIISVDEEQMRGLQYGAIAYLQKPVDPEALSGALDHIASFVKRRVRNLLVVEDDETQRMSIVELIGNSDVVTQAVESAEAALQALAQKKFDCMVLDLKLPGMNGFELIRTIRDDKAFGSLPIVVYTGKELTPKEETELRELTETIIVKDAKSPERLLDETALFLHRVEANLPEPKRKMLRKLYQSDPALEGRTVLIVDDDVRNIFAATSILERHKIRVLRAENGKEGIEVLQNSPGIELVLMDIMMPEMDGYEAMQRIRSQKKFEKLPIIALTAKAMKGDRERCIDAGASDYITKPIDSDQLLSLLRVWLY